MLETTLKAFEEGYEVYVCRDEWIDELTSVEEIKETLADLEADPWDYCSNFDVDDEYKEVHIFIECD